MKKINDCFNKRIILLYAGLIFITHPFSSYAEEASRWRETLDISCGMTSAIQGTSGNDVSGNDAMEDRTDYSYSLDINIESDISQGQKIIIHVETGEGDGAPDNFDTSISPNYDPYNTHNTDVGHQDITMSQAFYEGIFANGMLTVDIGKMDIHSFTDENNMAGDETTQFMASIFARLTGTLFNELDSYYAPGIRLFITPVEMIGITLIQANSNNDSLGIRPFNTGQLSIKPHFMGLEGNYRFYYLHDGREYTTISDGASTINTGYGVSFDQMLTNEIGLFFRYGSQEDDITVNSVDKAISGGIQVNGSLWGSKDDFIGIGYGSVKNNDKINFVYSGDQRVVELYYHWQATDNLGLTPDIQFHSNLPRVDKRDIIALGIRAQLDF